MSAGSHVLSIRQRSTPGATLRVEIRYAAARGPDEIAQTRAVADLEAASCAELNEVLEAAGPNESARIVRNYAVLGGVGGRLLIDGNAHGVPSLLAPLPVVDLGGAQDPSDRALAWMEQHRGIFRWTDPDVTLSALPALPIPGGGNRVTLEQAWRGLPVRGARLALIFDASSVVRAVLGNFVPEIADSGPARVSAAQASQIATLATGAMPAAPPTQEIVDMTVVDDRRATPLAWRVPTTQGDVWVDASTAEVLVRSGDAPGFSVTVVGPEADEGPSGEDLTATVHFDTSGRFTATGRCDTPDCVAATVFAGEADDFFENGMGRTGGWSGSGNALVGADAIAASAPYSILFQAPGTVPRFERNVGPPLALIDGGGAVIDDALLGPAANLAPADLTRDVVVHEFGHGALEVDLQTRRAEMAPSCEASAVREHVADTYTMLADATAGEPLERQLCVAGRDGDCRRLHGLVEPGVAPSACAGHGHLTALDDGLDRRGSRCFAYEESCVPSRTYGLALTASDTAMPVSYHGVTVIGPPLPESKALFDLSVHTALTPSTDHLGYGFAQQMSAFGVLAGCGTMRVCSSDLAERLATPFWAVGYWSAEQVLGSGLDTQYGPASFVLGSDTWVLFVPPRPVDTLLPGELSFYRDPNLLNDVAGTTGTFRTLTGAEVRPTGDLAAVATGGFVAIAAPTDADLTLITSTSGGASWDAPWQLPLDVADTPGAVAIATVAAHGLIAFERAGGGIGIATTPLPFRPLPSIADEDVLPESVGASSPALVQLSDTRFELWAREGDAEPGQLLRWVGRVDPTTGAMVLEPIPIPFGVVATQRLRVSDPEEGFFELMPTGGHEGGGTVVLPFLGRRQIYVQRTAGRVSGGVVRTDGDYVVAPPFLRLRGLWPRRPAAVNVTDPATGMPVHVLLSVGSAARGLPQRLVFSQKRSD